MLLKICWCYEKLLFYPRKLKAAILKQSFVSDLELHKALCTILTSSLCILEIFHHPVFSCDPCHLFTPKRSLKLEDTVDVKFPV